ncbi:MAG TPA: endonuclease III [Candidatus Saccharimonadales bacterium]|jgi:endonuclease-3|nr:endonuclease III [Candidatus Saccharimonadales bacterium]
MNKTKPAKPRSTKAGSGANSASRKPTIRKASTASSPGKFNPVSPQRVKAILQGLDHLYPGVTCALTHTSPWELLVATILSAQCTDARVNMVTPVIFRKYPTPRDFAALTPEQLEPDIHSTGFFRNKAKSIIGSAKKVVSEYGGNVPDEMHKLLSMPGVARKTANVVLGSWFGQAIGVVVDTHVHRIARRLELTRNNDPKTIEQDLMKVLPQNKWIEFSHQIIHHGRAVCVARRPRCSECIMERHCHAGDKTWSTVEIHKSAKL